MGFASGTVEMPKRLNKVGEVKLVSDPESRMTGTWSWVPSQEIRADRAGWEADGEKWLVTPVRIPSLTDGRCLFDGQVDKRFPDPPQYRQRWLSRRRCLSPMEIWCAPPAWTQLRALLRRGMVPDHGHENPSGSRRRREARRSANLASMRSVRLMSASRETSSSQVLSSSTRRLDSLL